MSICGRLWAIAGCGMLITRDLGSLAEPRFCVDTWPHFPGTTTPTRVIRHLLVPECRNCHVEGRHSSCQDTEKPGSWDALATIPRADNPGRIFDAGVGWAESVFTPVRNVFEALPEVTARRSSTRRHWRIQKLLHTNKGVFKYTED